ncbi:Gamma-glutamyl phosphate reductase [Fundidesulfovibrio magnetotacticus]|uniref:Gamma-glutamyl phosphate reductase n=1 Tax=Fundidesulfovibrio magnetotacticus TaxID=2730080 RepID=A0A6V8LUM7_9BACT|nr:glutamate-5-semialdehyde dehydrogenase [Fundidesulfovibrio magnetotacticus]GFK94281.1 Gamma-glutamyl phosphate reductase [Fundidesulfovibrio magnetotacticus]
MNIQERMEALAREARQAARLMAKAPGRAKDAALTALAGLLESEAPAIAAENARDIAKAEASGMDAAKLDRLRLTPKVLASMAAACRDVAAMPDPVGAIETMWQRPNGLMVGRMRIPLGVVCMIYESRPNVTVDSAILCLKAGNAVVLRGGSEAFHSNMALASLVSRALVEAGLPGGAVGIVPVTDRAAVPILCKLDQYIDVMIPRGGESLIRSVVEAATMPVLKHYKGVCHLYVDECADLDNALAVVENAKCQRPGVCNALECLLVHEKAAPVLLPRLARSLGSHVEFRACEASLPLLGPSAKPAGPEDWGCEFLDYVLAVRQVCCMDEALDHIAAHGSNHTECILTADHARAMRFLREADASMVGVNCSTRFNDGGELGLGAEIGISTSKLHAYGPMGVKELTGSKFVVLGQGQVRT